MKSRGKAQELDIALRSGKTPQDYIIQSYFRLQLPHDKCHFTQTQWTNKRQGKYFLGWFVSNNLKFTVKQTQGNKSTLNDKLLKYFLKKEAKCCRIDKINRLKNSDLLILLTNAIEPICTTTSRKRPPIRKNKKLGVSPMKVVRLGRTIAFYQVFFQQGRVALGK